MSPRAIDLNADLGEGGDDAALWGVVTSANVACGGHAGDAASMDLAVSRGFTHGVAIGAHPGYPDREGFGRTSMALSPNEVAEAVRQQVSALEVAARRGGATIRHVKPHGALYHDANRPEVAEAIAAGMRAALGQPRAGEIAVFGMAGAPSLQHFRDLGLPVVAEGFADRAYESDGTLRRRSLPGALLTDPREAAEQAVRLALSGAVGSVCVHSDTPGAAAIAAAVRRALEQAGFRMEPPRAQSCGRGGGPSGT